jgi:hypothetical protein
MDFNLSEAIRSLQAGAAFTVANQARPPASYLFATLLPERPDFSYQAKSGTMTVRATMAGLVGMDSPYPESGAVEVSTFDEATAKIANRVRLPEAALRRLQDMLMRLMLSGQPTNEVIQREALNFVDKLIVQSHLDVFEYLRGRALVNGQIDWTFNGKRLLVDYGVPTANKLTNRTGNDAYSGSASKFWDDMRSIQKLLRYNVRAFILHPETLDVILANQVNSLEVIAQNGPVYRVRRVVSRNAQNTPSSDARDTVELISYGLEGEVMDLANPGQTTKIPFMPKGKILGVAQNSGTTYMVGQGSTQMPELALGYTHLAPTVEGGGRPGRWADVRTPDGEPWSLEGRGVSNGLPVIEAYDKIAIASTDMPA